MKLSIIVPVHNRIDSVRSFLKQIYLQECNIDFNVIVVNDGSTDGTNEMIKAEYPATTIINGDGNWWWTKSVNEGIKHSLKSNCDAVLLMNDDTFFDINYLKCITKYYDGKSIIGSVGLIKSGNSDKIFFMGEKSFNRYTSNTIPAFKKFSPVPNIMEGIHTSVALPGRGLLIPCEIFNEIGFFDQEKLPQYKADYDFVLRAYSKGIKTYVCHEAIIFCDLYNTGEGSSFKKASLKSFFKSFFSKYTHNSLSASFAYKAKHGFAFLTPFLILYQFSASLLLFIYRNYFYSKNRI